VKTPRLALRSWPHSVKWSDATLRSRTEVDRVTAPVTSTVARKASAPGPCQHVMAWLRAWSVSPALASIWNDASSSHEMWPVIAAESPVSLWSTSSYDVHA